jgi:transcriptional regulator with XRE-family HTH domain
MKKTLTQMADIMGVAYQQYDKYETAKNRMRCGHLLLLAKHFGLDLNQFKQDPNQFIDLTVHKQDRVNAKFAKIEREINNESIISHN